MSRIWISLSLVALVAAAALALRDFARPEPVNVIVLTVESWRADAATPVRMPNLFKAARRGVTFSRHRAASAWTAPNVISVLTGISPFRQGVHARGHSLPAEYDLLTEDLARRGWDVGAVQAFMLIDLFDNLGLHVEPGTDPMSWIAQRARRGTPFFAWYHYLDSHLPYNPKRADEILTAHPTRDGAERRRRERVRELPAIPDGEIDFKDGDRDWVEALYRGGFEDFDTWFGQFWAFFDTSGLDENTILIVTADHGEEMLERGHVGHASTTRAGHLREELVRVPLFVWGPRERLPMPPGTVIDEMTDHLMIAPAIAGMLGLQDGPAFDSGGLFDLPRRTVWTGLTSRAGFSEADPDRIGRFYAAITEGDLKLHAGFAPGGALEIETFDLAGDPGERNPLIAPPPHARELAEQLKGKVAAMRMPPTRGPAGGGDAGQTPPEWVHPAAGGRAGYADIAGREYLEWSGAGDATYVVEYKAGSGLLGLTGTLEVTGTRYDFGDVTEGYWATWVVPYGHVAFRVRRADAQAWSQWIELELEP